MPLDPLPALAPPTVRQQSVVQNSGTAREVQIGLPIESLSSSRVVIVIFTTVSGGARAHIPSSQMWKQLDLAGTDGYARFGNTLISAWVSRPGITVYSAGSFKFAGLVGLAPEYCTALTFEFENCQNGQISLSKQTWNTDYANQVSGQAPAMGQTARGVLAVGYAEGEHNFLEPPGDQAVLTQTAASGFFAAPFTIVGTYAGQTSNDPSDVTLPFDGVASRAGILLFSAITGDAGINSPEAGHAATSFLSYPSATITTDADLGLGGNVDFDTDAFTAFDPMTVMSSTNSVLFGDPILIHTLGTQMYAQVSSSFTTSSALDVFNFGDHDTDAGLLGKVEKDHDTDALVVFGQEFSHSTNSYVLKDQQHTTDAYAFAGQTSHLTDALLMARVDLTHTTDAKLITDKSLSHFADAYLEAATPPAALHTTDAATTQDNIIGMSGWEMQDFLVECDPIATPNYSPSSTITTIVGAQRPGSQGAYGLRIDNTTAGADSYIVVRQSSKSLMDTDPVNDWPLSGRAAHIYSDMWTTVYFRCLDRPTSGSEMLIADALTQVGVTPPPLSTAVFGYCYWIALGNWTLSGSGGGLQLGRGSFQSSNVQADYHLSDTSWHKLEVRTYTASGVTLDTANAFNPVTVEVYLDDDLIMSEIAPYPCYGLSALGIQQRVTTERFRVDYDDMVMSTNRLNQYDLSVISKPAKAEGNYTAWTGTPSNTYTDVSSVPYDVAKYFESSALNQARTVKVYSVADANPYPGVIHAVSVCAVHKFNSSSFARNVALVVREGGTDYTLRTWAPNTQGKNYSAYMVTTTKSPVAEASWAAALYDFEIGVKQVIDSSVNRVNGLSVNLLVSPFSYSHPTDAMLYGEASSTHTTTSFLGRTLIHSTDALLDAAGEIHYADAMAFGLSEESQLTNSILLGEAEWTHATDTFVDLVLSQSVDAVIVDVRGSVHFGDSLLNGQVDTYHSTDGVVGALIDRPHYVDALPYRLVDSTHTTNSATLANPSIFHLANARMIAAVSATHPTTSLLRATISPTFSTNALKYTRIDSTHITNSSLKGEVSTSHSTSSATAPTTVVALLHTTGTLLRSSYSGSHTSSSFLKHVYSLTHSTDADLFGSGQSLHVTNARLVVPSAKVNGHPTDSDLSGERSFVHTTGAMLKLTANLTHTTNARIDLIPDLTHTTNGFLQLSKYLAHTSNAVLSATYSLTHSANALLQIVVPATHTTSFASAGEVNAVHTTNSATYGEVNKTHTTSASLKSEVSLTHTTSAAMAFEKLATTNSFIGISAQRTQDIASSLFGEAQALHSTNVVVYAQLSGQHTGSSSLLGEVQLAHTTSSVLLGSPAPTHTVDSRLATEKLHTTNAALAGESTGSHGTTALITNDDLGIFEQEQGTMFEGAF